jgi:hypothetical protein
MISGLDREANPVANRPAIGGVRTPVARRSLTHYWRRFVRWVRPPSFGLLAGVVISVLGVAFAATYLAHIPWWQQTDGTCQASTLGCGIAIHLVGTAIVALAAFYMLFLRQQARAALVWRSRARKRPEELFPWLAPLSGVTGLAARKPQPQRGPPALRGRGSGKASEPSVVDDLIPRDDLVTELMLELEAGARTQVIVGPTGSGKTMVLLKVAQRLAREGLIPVPVSLRDGAEVDFEERAWRAYRQSLPKCTDEEADRQWRWLRKGGRIVVLVDDLEKTKASPAEVKRALDAAAAHGLPILAAARPSAIPASFKRGRIDLEPLEDAAVRKDLTNRLIDALHGAPGERATAEVNDGLVTWASNKVKDLVEYAQIASTPYYVAVARVLADTGELATLEPERGEARLRLLDAYREVLRTGKVPLTGALSDERRCAVLDLLEPIAFARLVHCKTAEEVTGEVLPFWPDSAELDPATVIEYGQRLGILETRFDDVVRFGHPTTLAYLASCFLAKHKDNSESWNELLDAERITSTASLALVLASASVDDPPTVERTCRRLLGRPELVAGANRVKGASSALYDRILVMKTLTEIAANPGGPSAEVADRIIDIVSAEGANGSLALEQIRLVKEVAHLGPDGGHQALWTFIVKARDYRVRREAMRQFVACKSAAVAVGLGQIERVLDEADVEHELQGSQPVQSDRGELFDGLRAAAWVLPCLRSLCTETTASERLVRAQQRLCVHALHLTEQRGLEASIAQGLKLDAVRDPELPPDPVALQMLRPGQEQAKFWFSRVMLLQAVTTRCLRDERDQDARQAVLDARSDAHPFVRETARLCAAALSAGRGEPYLWEDLTEVAAGVRTGLSDHTKHLIGDIVLILNLNDHAPDEARIKFGHEARLPSCVERSSHRLEILGKQPAMKDCPFAGVGCLCPYTYDPPADGIRRELSRAFCRDRRNHAGRLPWHKNIGRQELQEFWRELETVARF